MINNKFYKYAISLPPLKYTYFLFVLLIGCQTILPRTDEQNTTIKKLDRTLGVRIRLLLAALETDEEETMHLSFLKNYSIYYNKVLDALEIVGNHLKQQCSELNNRIDSEIEGFHETKFSFTPIVLYENIGETDVIRSWKHQLIQNLKQI